MSSLIPLHALAFARIGVGIALLTVPAAAASTFLIPVAPAAILGIRLAGARDLAIGSLLFHTSRRQTSQIAEKSSADSSIDDNNQYTTPLLDVDPRIVQAQHDSMIKAVLATGIMIDAVDMLSCAVCFAEGNLPGDAALLVGGLAGGAVGLGLYNYLRTPWAARA